MKRLLLSVFAFLILFSVTSYAEEEEIIEPVPFGFATELYTPKPKKAKLFSAAPTNPTLYEVIESAMLNKDESKKVYTEKYGYCYKVYITDFGYIYDSESTSHVPADVINAAYNVVYNHPERGDLFGMLGVTKNKEDGTIMGVLFKYADDYDQSAYEQAVDLAASECINNDMTDMQKIMSIHDYLADKFTYYPGEPEEYRNCYTGWGAFVEKQPACQGYAIAFKLMCDRAGIICGYAVSQLKEHIWNLVELDGKFYHIDVTWDDKKDCIEHKYFLLSDAKNAKNRGIKTSDYVCNYTPTEDTTYDNDINKNFFGKAVWYKDMLYLARERQTQVYGGDIVYLPYQYYTYDGTQITEITKAEYLPKENDYKIYNLLNKSQSFCNSEFVSIHGVPQTDATLFAADYDDTGRMMSVSKDTVEFDDSGVVLYKITDSFDKLFLLDSDGSCTPLAEYQTKSKIDMR